MTTAFVSGPDRLSSARGFDLSRRFVAADGLCDLEWHQLRRVPGLAWSRDSRLDRRVSREPEQKPHDRRAVEDDHRRSRSARMTSSGLSSTDAGGRERTRATSSS